MKAKLVAIFTKDLNKFKVNVNAINYAEDKNKKVLTLHLISDKDRRITQLLEYLTKAHEGKYDFDLQEIRYDQKQKAYLSELKVTLL